MENDLQRVWLIISELSEQIAHNHKLSAALASQAGTIKGQVAHVGNGYSLRRFNVDLSQETFESELERTSAQIIIENQFLLHENKQLSLLLKEYEGTMSTILDKFRNHALAAQQHETTLQRHYETLLYTRETQSLASDINSSNELARSVQRLCYHLRNLLRSMAGENPEDDLQEHHHPNLHDYDPSSPSHPHSAPVDVNDLLKLLDELDSQTHYPPSSSRPTSPSSVSRQDWALERESEISRLEAENAELRRALGIDPETIKESGVDMESELARMNAPRNLELVHRTAMRSRSGSGASPVSSELRPSSFWDPNGSGVQQQQQGPFNNGGGPPPPLPQGRGGMDFANGMRMMQGMQGRRAGMFGTGQQRGGIGGETGRGMPIPLPPPSTSISLWNNQPVAPQPERTWQAQGSALDMNR